MATPRFAWGIDIGNRALKAVKLVRDGDGVRIDDFEFLEHETLLSNAGDNKETLVQNALANFTGRHPTKGGVVSIGVSGQNSFARFVKLPPVDEKRIPEIVRFEAIQQIPFPLDDVEWSYQLFREEDNPEIEVGIFAMRRELVNQHIGYFTDFGLNVQTVQMNPLAVYNALQFDGRFNDGVSMVVDVGTDNTDLLIASNESIWMRSIPIGGSNFTEALVKAFKLNAVKAEDLKRNAATSKYARQIFQHMRPVFADLVAEIQRSIGFYSSVHRDAKIGKIYTLGGTFKLPGLQKYLQQNLQLPVERIDNFSAGQPEDPKQGAMFGDNLLSIVAAYGLAVQAMGGAMVNSSLLPRAIQKERVWQEKTPWFALAAALCVAVPIVGGARVFFEDLQWKNAAKARADNAQVLSHAEQNSTAWRAIQGSGETERTTNANLNTMNDGKYLQEMLLADLIGAIPAPPPALAAAMASGNADEIKKIPRGERQMILIDEILPRYDPTLAAKLAVPGASAPAAAPSPNLADPLAGLTAAAAAPAAFGAPDPNAAAGGAAAADPTGKGRGFLVTLRVTCPAEKANEFVETKLKPALEAVKPSPARPDLPYAVKQVWLVSNQRIAQDSARQAKLNANHAAVLAAKAAAAAGTAVPGATGTGDGYVPPVPTVYTPGAGGAGTTTPDANEGLKDRVTGESVLQDWAFELVIAVELDPGPYTPPAVDPNAAPAATPPVAAASPVRP